MVFVGMLLCSMLLSSCKKDVAADFLGTYHFKMSGNFMAQAADGTKVSFVLSSQFGTMTNVHGQNGGYFVNMSVFMGDVMTFNAKLDGKNLELDSREVVVNVTEEGKESTLFSSPTKNVTLTFCGTGARYDNTIVFKMSCSGQFVYGENSKTYTVLNDSNNIVCVATDL